MPNVFQPTVLIGIYILVYRQEAVLINVYHCFKAMSSLFGLMSMSVSAFFFCVDV